MPYNVANNLRVALPDPIGVDQLKRKNVLADQQVANDQQRNALYGQQIQQNDQRFTAAQEAQAIEQVKAWAPGAIAQVEKDPTLLPQFLAAGQRLGIFDPKRTPDSVTPQDVAQLKVELGLMPAQAEKPYGVTEQPGPYGSKIVTDGSRFQVVTPPRGPAAPKPAASAGGPAGGQTAPPKPRKLSAPELKAMSDARVKLPRVDAAIRRIDRVGKALESFARGPLSRVADTGPLDKMVIYGTKAGQELRAATASLMPELQALTRVPGIGAQSDLEARLAQLALPSLDMDPETNARTYEELKAFMADLDAAYKNLASGRVNTMPDGAEGAGPVGENIVDWNNL